MTLHEKIQKKAKGYGKLAPVFLEGAKFALENPWISVDDDLPCNHEELLNAKCQTKEVFILKCGGFTDVDYMLKIDGNGYGLNIKVPNFGCQFQNFKNNNI